MKNKIYIAAFALLFWQLISISFAQSPPVKQWDVRFGSTTSDVLYQAEQTTDGGYILGGTSDGVISGDKSQGVEGGNDFWIVKTDGNGTKQWDKTYMSNGNDQLWSLFQTSDGGYILGGNSDGSIGGDKTQNSQGNHDYWIVKTDANGTKQWDARFGAGAGDYLWVVQQTSDGGYILGGYSLSGSGGDKTQGSQGGIDYWIVKTDASGVKQWDARFGGSSDDVLQGLIQTTDGGYLLTGESASGSGGDKTQSSQGGSDYWIIKTNSTGTKLWDARFGGTGNEYCKAIMQTTDGNYLVGGFSTSGIGGDKSQASQGTSDYWIVLIDENGNKIWDKRFGGTNDDALTTLEETFDGGYVLGGYSTSTMGGDRTQASQGGNDYWIVKTNASGIAQWDSRYGSSADDNFYALHQTSDNGFILGGYTSGGISGDKSQASRGGNDYWILKLAPDCTPQIFYADTDNDGYGSSSDPGTAYCDPPSGVVTNNSDCNDGNFAFNPAAQEVCDGSNVDEDCDGLSDDADPSAIGKTIYYADTDNDGYGSSSDPGTAYCDPPSGVVTNNSDCNDGNFAINPAAQEVCDGSNADEDCDGLSDDADPSAIGKTIYYVDADIDSYGSSSDPGTAYCDPPSGVVTNNSDCNDGNFAFNPAAQEVCDGSNVDEDCDGLSDDADPSAIGKIIYYVDADIDSYGSSSDPGTAYCDPPSGVVTNNSDCNDGNFAINPAAQEVCDGSNVDEDCDGLSDDADPSAIGKTIYYVDADIDSYGSSSDPGTAYCDPPSGVVTNNSDCNDGNFAFNPAAQEVCDGSNADEDCDGLSDDADPSAIGKTIYYADTDNDGYGSSSDPGTAYCDPPSGVVTNNSDCNDGNFAINPAAQEVCDGSNADEDCDGLSDDVDPSAIGKTIYYADTDNDGYGSSSDPGTAYCDPPSGVVTNNSDCNDGNFAINPAAQEVCDGSNADEDCDGLSDDNDPSVQGGQGTYYVDGDGDGFGAGSAVMFCVNPGAGYSTNDDDCDDGNNSIHPNATETCNGIDDDCDGVSLTTTPTKQWDTRFGGSGEEGEPSSYADFKMQQTSDGGYILGGNSKSDISGDKTQNNRGGFDYWIVKTDAGGAKQWDARFGGSSDDILLSIQQTADGGYILGGESSSGITGDRTQDSRGGIDYWIVKTDMNGVKEWDVRFGGSSDDGMTSLRQTSDGGYLFGGFSGSVVGGDKTEANEGSSDMWVVKTDANGVKQWDKTYGSLSGDDLYSLIQTTEGGYVLLGASSGGISGDKTQPSRGASDYWMVKTDVNGVKEWDVTFGGSDNDFFRSDHCLQQTTDGGYIVGGISASGMSGDRTQPNKGIAEYDFWVVKTNAYGVKQWDAAFGGNDYESCQSLQQTSDGGYIFGGQSLTGISGDKTVANKGASDFWIIKTDVNGVKQWDAGIGGTDWDLLYDLQQTTDGGYILGGYSKSCANHDKNQTSRGDYDFWIYKLQPECVPGTFYADADNDGYGNPLSTTSAATLPSGYRNNSSDCNDNNASIYPCRGETCNNVDDNCDGITDEGVQSTFYADADNDGYGNAGVTTMACTAPSGYVADGTDCNDGNTSVHPNATEVCNTIDDDCDLAIDEGVQLTFYADTDNDGYGNSGATTMACTAPSGYVADSTDCNDGNATMHSFSVETCNAIDDDCDGTIDDTRPPIQWDATFGGIGDESNSFVSVQQTSDGGYILGGSSNSAISGDKSQNTQGGYDFWIVKTDANGSKQWDADFGGDADERLFDVIQTSDGGYLLGGQSNSGISGDKTQASQGSLDAWFVKTDANGVKQWDARFGGTGSDEVIAVQQTADGGYILGGTTSSDISGDVTQSNQGQADYWIVKIDASGVKQWDSRFGGNSNDFVYSLQQTADGGFIVGGISLSALSGDKTQAGHGGYDYWMVKTDAFGIKQWDAAFGTNVADWLYSVQQTSDGGYVMGGHTTGGIDGDKTQASQGDHDYWIVKTDANGVKQWDADYGSDHTELIGGVQQTTNGGYIAFGRSNGLINGDKSQNTKGSYDYWIVKADANGVKQWDADFGGTVYGSTGTDNCDALFQTSDGGYLLAGVSSSCISGDKTEANRGVFDYYAVNYDYWIVKVAPEGTLGTFYADADGDGYGNPNLSTTACSAAPSGYVSNSGDCNDGNTSVHPTCDDDGLSTFYADADTDGYGNLHDSIIACSAPSGYVSDNTDCNDGDMTVHAISTEICNGIDDDCDGTIDDTRPPKEWDATFGGSGTEGNSNGDVTIQQTSDGGYIVGTRSNSGISGDKTQNSFGGYDYWIVKTDANGLRQWDKTFGGSSDDFLWDIEQTSDGGYILGGTSYSIADGNKTAPAKGGTDYWIVKTNSLGEMEWDKTFSGGGDNNEDCRSIQQTTDGGYFLGGQSGDISGNDKSQDKGGYWIVKINSSGVKEWDAAFTSVAYFTSGQQTSDDGFILIGQSIGGMSVDKSQDNFGGYDYWILKCDAFGVRQWDASFGGTENDAPLAIMQTSDDGYIIAGHSDSDVSGNKTSASKGGTDMWVVRTNSIGEKLWDVALGGTGGDACTAVQIASDGGFIFAGESGSGISGDKTQNVQGDYDYWLVKTDANGVKQWDADFGGSAEYIPSSKDYYGFGALTSDGGFIFAGQSNSCIGNDKTHDSRGGFDIWIVKVAPEGTLGTYYADADGDSYGNPSVSTVACSEAPSGYVSNSGDCNDNNSSIHPTCAGGSGQSTFYSDTDGDGFGNPNDSIIACSAPSGYVSDNTDCNDADASVHSISSEICNGIDDDCDGTIDDTRPPKQWDARLGGDADDWLTTKLQQTSDGGYIIGITSESGISGDKTEENRGGYGNGDYWIIRTDANGVKQWDKTYGGSGDEAFGSVQQTTDGGFIFGGTSPSSAGFDKTEESRGGDDYWIIKTDANGVKQWDKTYGGSETDQLFDLQQTIDGGYIFGGSSSSPISGDKTQDNHDEGSDMWVVKTDANGVKQWDARYGGLIDSDELYSLQQTTDGGYILAGLTSGDIGGEQTNTSRGSHDMWIVKIDASGVQQWDARFGGGNADILNSVQQTADGGYILGGGSQSVAGFDKTEESRGGDDFWIIKTDANGVKQWDATFGGSDADDLLSVRQTNDGGYVLAGYSQSDISGDKTQPTLGGYDYWFIKTDVNGIMQWDSPYGTSDHDYLFSCELTIDGGYILGGYSNGCGNDKSQSSRGGNDLWMVKVAPEGTLGTFYADADGDGSGNPDVSTMTCAAPSGYVPNSGDCNDNNSSAHQCQMEDCNGIDDNCDGVIDEGGQSTFYVDTDNDGYGDPDNSIEACSALAGYVADNTDCNDGDSAINPAATEICDGLNTDEDCDALADDNDPSATGKTTFYVDADNDGYGSSFDPGIAYCDPPSGVVTNNSDCDDGNAATIACLPSIGITFQRTFGGTSDDGAYAMVKAKNGGFVLAGFTTSLGAGSRDIYLVKVTESGDTIWTKTFGGTGLDECWWIDTTSDGGYILTGNTTSFGAGNYDIYLIKTDSNGNMLWSKTFGGGNIEYGYSVQQTFDGGYIVGGWTRSYGGGGFNMYLIKTDANGNPTWTKTYGGGSDDGLYMVKQTADSGYIISGWTYSYGAGGGGNPVDLWLIKTDVDGNVAWTKTFGGTAAEVGLFAVPANDGGYLVSGYAYSFGAGSRDLFLIKTDDNGNKLWSKTYGGANQDEGRYILPVSGGYVLADWRENTGFDWDVYLMKIDNIGNMLWSKNIGGTGQDVSYVLQPSDDGGYMLAGTTQSFGAGSMDAYLIKSDNNGNSSCNESDASITVALQNPSVSSPFPSVASGVSTTSPSALADGGGVISEICSSLDNDGDGYTIAQGDCNDADSTVYPNATEVCNLIDDDCDGFSDESVISSSVPDIEWQKPFGGSIHEYFNSIQQTADGGYIAVGNSRSNDGDVSGNHAGSYDVWVVKFDTAQNIEWQRSLGGNSEDAAFAVQQTSDGEFIVAGYAQSNDGDVMGHHGGFDSWVVKLSAAGNIVWQKAYGGTLHEYFNSIQQTADEGFIAAGNSRSNDGDVSGNHAGSYDCWIVKLNSLGAIEWQKSLGGTTEDIAYSIRQSADGGYIFTGSTLSNEGDVSGNHGGYDSWVVKLDASGNISWQKCLGGSADEITYSVKQMPGGEFIVAGYAQSNNGDVSGNHGGYDCWVVKLTPAGNIIWQKTYGGSIHEYFQSIDLTTDGGFIAAGNSRSNDGDVTGNHALSYDIWVVRLDAAGNLVWQKSLGGNTEDIGNSVRQTSDNGFVVAGYTLSNDGDVVGSHGGYDCWAIKFAPDSISSLHQVFFADADGDTYGDADSSMIACSAPAGFVSDSTDCDDGNMNVNPVATEVCNGIDDNCNQSVDDQVQPMPGKIWDARFGGTLFDELLSLEQTIDGGYIAGGRSNSDSTGDKTQASRGGYDLWIVKTNDTGEKEWDRRYGGSGDESSAATNAGARDFDLQQTLDGGYLITGSSNSGIGGDKSQPSQGDYDYWMIKSDSVGNALWNKTYGGNGLDEVFTSQETADGGYILGGTSYTLGANGDKSQPNNGSSSNCWIVKTFPDGAKQWDVTLGGGNSEGLVALQQTSDGGYILGAHTSSAAGFDVSEPNFGVWDFWLVKTNSLGAKLWDHRFGGSSTDICNAIQQTTDGGYILGGYSNSGASGNKSSGNQGGYDYWVIKTDVNGLKQWDKTFGGTSDDYLSSVKQTSDGGYLLSGLSLSSQSGDKSQPTQGGYDYWIVKVDASGTKLWDTRYGGTNNETLTAARQTIEGGFILGGYTSSGVNGDVTQASRGNHDFWIVKLTEGQSAFFADADNDGYGNPGVTTMACTAPGGYVSNNTDCNDGDASIHPNATEICNTIDDDCDLSIDEGVQSTFYADADNDGYGNPGVTTMACTAPGGYVSNNTDCDDGNASIHPNATEICNTIDDDCDLSIDEGVQSTFYADADNDGYGNPGVTTMACTAPGGYVSNNTDCDDGNASIHPNATEICNTIDDDCDLSIDEGVQSTFYADADNDGYGNPGVTTMACTAPGGYVSNNTDCDDGNASVHPNATEICNTIDDDCDLSIDEGVQSTFYADADNDGYGNPGVTTLACTAPGGYVSNDDDCNDANSAVNPAATEITDGFDNNCDGQIDEGISTIVNTLWETNNTVRSLVIKDSLLYIGGDFTQVYASATGAVRISAANALPLPGWRQLKVQGGVMTSVKDGAGGFYIGGFFFKVGDSLRNNLAHINAAGSVTNWNPNADAGVFSLGYSGGNVYAGGLFRNVGGQVRNFIAAIDGVSGSAGSWNPNANNWVTSLAISGSTVYAGGYFISIGGQNRNRIAALNITTGTATSWNPNANAGVICISISGNTIYSGGYFTSIGGQTRSYIAAIDAVTATASSWNPNANSTVFSLAVSGSTIYTGGTFSSIGGQSRNNIAAINSASGTATSWNPNANSGVYTISISGSTIYTGGYFTTISGQSRNGIATIDAITGTVSSWNPNINGGVHTISVSGNTVFAGGFFSSIGAQTRNRIAALNINSGVITAWNPNANGTVYSIGTSGNTVYAGGSFTTIGGLTRNRIAAINATSAIATTWNPNANNTVQSLFVSGTIVYAGGLFTSIGGQTRNRIAALNTGSGAAITWNPNANNAVQSVFVSGSTIYAGGSFTSIGGQTRNRIAALNNTTGTATTWNPNANNTVQSLFVFGTTIYAGGTFTTIGGQTRNRIAALNISTGAATTWNPNANNAINTLLLAGNTAFAGGNFTTMGGNTRNRIAAIDATTGSATSWNPDANNSIYALALSGNTVFAGGAFTTIGGQSFNYLAAIDYSGSIRLADPFVLPGWANYDSSAEWNIYPNPSTGKVVVEIALAQESATEIRIADMAGKVLLQSDEGMRSGSLIREFDLSRFSDGSYLIQLTTNHKSQTRLLIIQK